MQGEGDEREGLAGGGDEERARDRAADDLEADFIEGDEAARAVRREERAAGQDGVVDPLEGLVTRVADEGRPELAFEPAVIDAAVTLEDTDGPAFQELVRALKAAKVGITDWRDAVKRRRRQLADEAEAKAKRAKAEAEDAIRVAAREREAAEAMEREAARRALLTERPELAAHFGAVSLNEVTYEVEPGRTLMKEWRGMGSAAREVTLEIADFSAAIVAEVETVNVPKGRPRLSYELSVLPSGRKSPRCVELSNDDFNRMGWVSSEVRSDGGIAPGRDMPHHLREAIRRTSKARGVECRRRYGYTGWQEIEGVGWVYLHGAGAIGADGAAEGVTVDPRNNPFILPFAFPTILDGDALRAGVEACASLFLLGSPQVACSVFGATWRSALGRSPLSVYLSAAPETGKTMWIALAQQHFGAAFNESDLPVVLEKATDKSIDFMRFVVGDAVFAIDDLVVTGTGDDMKMTARVASAVRGGFAAAQTFRLNREADGVRVQGAPRSTGMFTGETVPARHSLRTRMLVPDLDRPLEERIEHLKRAGSEGLFAGTMAAFLRWLAPRYGEVRAGLGGEIAALTAQLSEAHVASTRIPGLAAEVGVGVKYFLEFAADAGLDAKTIAAIQERTLQALGELVPSQRAIVGEADPARRFPGLLGQAMQTGRGYFLTATSLGAPEPPQFFGWRAKGAGTMTSEPDYAPQGAHLGYVDTKAGLAWIFPKAALAAAREAADRLGEPLGLNIEQLGPRLDAQGLLERPGADSRTRYLVRKSIKGRVMNGFLCLRLSDILGTEPEATVAPTEGDSVGGVGQGEDMLKDEDFR